MTKIIVIGAGPAGMMAAITARENGKDVLLLEKNEKIGKKLYITGKGRCNLTNDTEPQNFIKQVATNPKFLMSAINAFSPQTAMSYFSTLGLPLKTERGNRVFPISDKSGDVLEFFDRRMKKLGVDVHLNEMVVKIVSDGERITAVVTNKSTYNLDALIIATGGVSYPLTGATGDGYKFASTVNHTVVEPKAALAPILINGTFGAKTTLFSLNSLPLPEGLSLKNVTLKAINLASNKVIFSELGEMLFMDNGVTGPLVLTASSLINKYPLKDIGLSIDFKPALTAEALDARILRDFKENNNKQFKNALGELLPKSLIPYIIVLSNINPDIEVNSITREERQGLVGLLKNFTMSVKSLGDIKEAIVTSGGVSTKEVSPKTMQSKIINNLYFAGEVLDVDGFTGGFNIQIALSTGYLAGLYAE